MSHAHSHGCSHGDPRSRAYRIAILLNSTFVAIEFAFGMYSGSTALIADASHNLSDVLGLLLSLTATILSARTPDVRYTYGLRSTTILAALFNAMLLLAACGAIALESIQRLSTPHAVDGATVMTVAAIGMLVNGLSAWQLNRSEQHDLNMRGAYLHMLFDALVSAGVVVAGIAMIYTDYLWIDPLISLLILAVVISGSWSLLRGSLRLALNAVPEHIDIEGLARYLRGCTGVADMHDLHVWGMSTTDCALTVHLVMPEGYPGDEYMDEIACTLREQFKIAHSTLQIEQGTTQHRCVLHEHSSVEI